MTTTTTTPGRNVPLFFHLLLGTVGGSAAQLTMMAKCYWKRRSHEAHCTRVPHRLDSESCLNARGRAWLSVHCPVSFQKREEERRNARTSEREKTRSIVSVANQDQR